MGDDRKFNLTLLNTEFAKLSYLTARVLESLDSNGDKNLTLDEYSRLDVDGDRFLLRGELRNLIGEIKDCDGLCKLFMDDTGRIEETISELRGIEFYKDVFLTEFNSVEDIVKKRRAQGYRMNWYYVLDKTLPSPRRDSAEDFLNKFSGVIDAYDKTGKVPEKEKIDLLLIAADNYTDIFDFMVSFFARLEARKQDGEHLENLVFLLNNSLGYMGGNVRLCLIPPDQSGKYAVTFTRDQEKHSTQRVDK